MNLFQRIQYTSLKNDLKHSYHFTEQPYNTLTAHFYNNLEYIFAFDQNNKLIQAQVTSKLHPNKWIDITNAMLPKDIIMRELATEFKQNQHSLKLILEHA